MRFNLISFIGICKGSYEAQPCPLGTYSNVTGAVNEQGCRDCDAGYYCSSVAGGEPTGPCDAGHYCTGSAQNARQHIVDEGIDTTQNKIYSVQ